MRTLTVAAISALGLIAAVGPVAGAHAQPAPSTLEQAVHANVRIMRGGAIPGDDVPFSAFEYTRISAADILNRQELYHVAPDVTPAAPGYEITREAHLAQHTRHAALKNTGPVTKQS
jgi:hypothetical protein